MRIKINHSSLLKLCPMSPSSSPQSSETLAALQHLMDVVAKLRSPDGGCPWDLAQTPQTLTSYVIEEAYEVVDAIQRQDQAAIQEELGDLLLQVVLQAQIASEAGNFSLQEVAEGITEKLIRRHPHVFSDVEVQDAEEVHRNWERIKAEEKGETPETPQPLSEQLSRYSRSLPPLMAGMKISKKAAAAGFEWDDVEGVWQKFEEELAEFQQALAAEPPENQQAELGDLLFTIINIARWHKLDPSEALQGTNQRFIKRLQLMEAFADRPLQDYTIAELETLWQQAKAHLKMKKG